MSAEINYKNKYMELRAKYMNDLDMAFRLGFEQGGQQAQQDQMAQQQAEAQAMQQAALAGQGGEEGGDGGGFPGQEGGGEQPGQPGQEPGAAPGAASGAPGQPGGSELDQHINTLESMLKKPGAKPEEIQKSLQELVAFRKSELQALELRKSAAAIKGIAKALHKPQFKMSATASHNLKDNAKQAVSMQHKIVSNVMAKMEEEERRASTDIKSLLNIEGLTKK